MPAGTSIPQKVLFETFIVLVGEVRRKPETAVATSLKTCSVPPKVKVEVA